MDSDIPTQSADKTCRVGDAHLALVSDKGVLNEQVQWRHPEINGKIVMQTRQDPGASPTLDGGGLYYLRGWPKNAAVFCDTN